MTEYPTPTPKLTIPIVAQRVRRLSGTYTVAGSTRSADVDNARMVTVVVDDEQTFVEDAGSSGDWIALYTGDTAHDLDTAGMTVSLIAPLSVAGIPIFVASTMSADLVFVPARSFEAAVSSLVAAGHTVVDERSDGPGNES
ncbi:ACT domain-containing protein [Leifsonia sp. RAF41]|uniref:ACT domain-containing protein n=1 Tax=Leifsonia sp. RAF41 TaxID=3233056 RepID=UPI003F94DD9A